MFGFFFFFFGVWLCLLVVVVVEVVGVVDVRGGYGWCWVVFLGNVIYYFIVGGILFYCRNILFYCDVYIILLR